MAGVPVVKLEHRVNGTWLDVSSRLLWSESGQPLQVTSGVTEDGGVMVGVATFTLDNTDGALTPHRSSSPHYPHLVRWRPVRLSVQVAGVWRERHYGYLDDEVLSWGNAFGTDCRVTWSTIDHFGMAALKTLRSVTVESLASLGPWCYWPLTDSETAAAADQSRYPRPALAARQVGSKGEIGWSAGTQFKTESTGGLTLTPASDEGWMLLADGTVDLPASWSLSVWISPAAKDGYVCQVGTDQYAIGIWYDTSTKKLSAVETIGEEDDAVDRVLSTTSGTWSSGVETLTVTATTVKLGSSGTTGARRNRDRMDGSYVAVGGSIADPPSRARMYSGEVKHLAIWSGAVPTAAPGWTTGGPLAMYTMASAIDTVLTWAGVATPAVLVSGTNRPVELVKTEGMTATDVISTYARGSLARIYCEGGPDVRVLDFDYFPAAASAPTGVVESSIEWGVSLDSDITDASMSWSDGSSYTASEESAYRSGIDLPGVLPIAIGRSIADWVVGASQGAPGIPAAEFDLLTMPDVTAVANLTVAARITIPGLPSQLPASSQTGMVRQITETIGASVWTRALVIDADLRDKAFVVGDAVKGVVGAGFLAGPLGSGRGGMGAWRAGEPVDASRLNGRQYAGGQMQAGKVTITPVANTNTSLAVTFPTPFASAPKVVVTPITSQPFTEVKGFSVSSVTTTGFTLWVQRSNATPTEVSWMAA